MKFFKNVIAALFTLLLFLSMSSVSFAVISPSEAKQSGSAAAAEQRVEEEAAKKKAEALAKQTATNDAAAKKAAETCASFTSTQCGAILNDASQSKMFEGVDAQTKQDIISKTIQSRKLYIELYAPFASKGGDIYCKTVNNECNSSTAKEKGLNLCFNYTPMPNGGTCSGSTVQILASEQTSESVAGTYVGLVFRFALGLAAAISILMIIVGGIQIITSMGSSDSVSGGIEKIKNGAIGMALLLLSGMILYTINPLFFTLSQ